MLRPQSSCLVALVVLAAAMGSSSEASAQACCTATGAGEYAVVGRCQSAVMAGQLTYQRGMGSYAADGNYHQLDDARVHDWVLSLGGGLRPFSPNWQVYASVPLRLQERGFTGTAETTSAGVGDAALAVRWTALEDIMEGFATDDATTWVPFVDLYVGAKLPTGRAPEDTEVTTGSDITGDGSWQLQAGAKVSKFVLPEHVLGLGGQYSHRFARDIAYPGGSTTYAPAPEWAWSASYLHIPNLFWSWGLTGTWKTSGTAYSNGEPVARSAQQRLSFGAHVTHGFDFPWWEVTLSATADAWWDDAGQNVPFVGPSASLALRRQFR